MSQELKACPFCQADDAKTVTIRDGRRVVCGQCGASSGSQFHGPLSAPSANQRAIAAWNTRPESPSTPAPQAVADAIERAAKVADAHKAKAEKLMARDGEATDTRMVFALCAEQIAAAIRALSNEGEG